jgi:hypothetical protein
MAALSSINVGYGLMRLFRVRGWAGGTWSTGEKSSRESSIER